jgi:metal-responsive CopG/Arc/MetJ family transcriptional regulator
MTKYDLPMSVERITVSLESDLAEAVRDAAVANSTNVSAWFADAARRYLASRGLSEVVAEWEAKHGAFSETELLAARKRLTK